MVQAQIRLNETELTRSALKVAAPKFRSLDRRIVTRAKQLAPVDTGNLRRTIGSKLSAAPPFLVLIVWSKANYSRFVHDGTRPHLIQPRRRRALKFKVAGRTVFARSVLHPGQAGKPFLRTAVQEEIARLR